MKMFCTLLVLLLVCIIWHDRLPKTAPNSKTMALEKQPSLLVAASIDLAAITGQWKLEDRGLITVATLPDKRGDLVLVGLPDGHWYGVK